MHVFYINRKYIYIALFLLILIYILLFYILSIKENLYNYTNNISIY